MKGLRTQEENNFIVFFELVQKEAEKMGCTFFLDCGLGKVYKNIQIECEDMCGWLIPEKHTKEFEYFFLNNLERVHDFDDFYTRVDYSVDGENIYIVINEI